MEPKIRYWTSVVKNIVVFIVSILLIFLLFKLSIFYIPFLIGFIISLLIEPLIRKIADKTGIARKICAIIVLAVLFSVLIGLITWGIITLVTESSNLLQSINTYIEKIYNFIQDCILKLQTIEIKIPETATVLIDNCTTKLLTKATEYTTNFLTNAIQKITSLPTTFVYVIITIISTYFICTDRFFILDQLEHHVPRNWVKKFGSHLREILSTLGNYLKAESILIFISFLIILIGLYIGKCVGLNIEYPLLSALGIAFVDALPILGSGTVMLPWAIISALDGNISLAILLIGLYIFVLIIRQILEPKLISKKIGIHPIFTLIAMYTGFKVLGIWGMFLGPIILIILKNIFANMIDDGIVKTIFKRN